MEALIVGFKTNGQLQWPQWHLLVPPCSKRASFIDRTIRLVRRLSKINVGLRAAQSSMGILVLWMFDPILTSVYNFVVSHRLVIQR